MTRAALLIVLLAACGGDDPAAVPPESFDEACGAVPGCGEPRSAGPAERLYRVELTREADGSVSIGEIRTVEVLADGGAPIGALGGRYTLSGRDAGGVDVDGQWLQFPEVIEFESHDDFGERIALPLTGPVTAIGFVRVSPELETLAVVDQMDGTVVAEVPIPTETAEDLAVAGARSALIRATSAPSCGHIVVLERGTLADVPFVSGEVTVSFEAPGFTQLAVIDAALGRMPKMLCHGVARIAFVDLPTMPELGGFVWGGRVGDLVLLNVSRQDEGVRNRTEEALTGNEANQVALMRTIVHEGGHAVDNLLGSAANGPRGGDGSWVRSSRGLARQTVDHVRIRRGMRAEWERLHATFVAQGWAEDHPANIAAAQGAGIDTYTAEATANAGAMSRYGATSSAEDIADFVSWALMGPAFAAAGYPDARRQKEDFACQAMATYAEDGGIPSRYSAVFAKLMFLRDLGVVWPEDVERCLGRVGYRDVPEGFQFTVDGEVRQQYSTELSGSLGVIEATGRRVFAMTAGGRAMFGDTTYPATAELRIDLAPATEDVALTSWPRGVYRFAPGSPHSFTLRLPDAPAGNFDVTDGWILIGESSNDRIRGSIFITEAFRLSAPVPVPQVFEPPLLIQVRLDGTST